MLPLALADGQSELRTSEVTAHLLTNAEVIRLFLPVEIGVDLAGGETMSESSEKNNGATDEPILRVERYAGHRADTEPRRLHVGQREVSVMEILDRWLDPRHRYFKLRGDDGIYMLRHDTIEDRWEMPRRNPPLLYLNH